MKGLSLRLQKENRCQDVQNTLEMQANPFISQLTKPTIRIGGEPSLPS